MKFIKRLIIFILFLVVVVLGLSIFAISRIKAEVTASDLPQDVYESSGDFTALIQAKALEIVLADEEDSYTLMEEFINFLILDIIRENVNAEYDPLNGETEESQYIINHEQFQLDYIYAHLNEENQIIITVSIKRDTLPKAMTAFHFVFDVEYEISTFSLVLTLSQVYLHNIEVKRNIYDYFVSMADKDQIEAYVDTGTLDLDEYTYTINFWDLI
ncbi:MAG: hypothetical protein RQ856_03940 [Candidatus Izemoplasmatales bacterium]|nr:hypothetical protein [Candidatus Izemoplasmatales bacterium]